MKFTALLSTAALASTVLGALQLNHGRNRRSLIARGNSSILVARDNEQTDDWAGAVLKSPPENENFASVSGVFTVPNADADTSVGTSAVSIWVGIDGYDPLADPTIQAGIDVIKDAGDDGDDDITYKAWVEWTNAPANYIDERSFSFTEGDQIRITVSGVTAGGTTASALFENLTEDESFPQGIAMPSGGVPARAANMEWMVERLKGLPDTDEGQTSQLLNFGTIVISECQGNLVSGGAIDFTTATAVDMYAQDTASIEAATVLDTANQKVTICWLTCSTD